jgi:hypothetical protein
MKLSIQKNIRVTLIQCDMRQTEERTANKGLAKVAVQCSADTFVYLLG